MRLILKALFLLLMFTKSGFSQVYVILKDSDCVNCYAALNTVKSYYPRDSIFYLFRNMELRSARKLLSAVGVDGDYDEKNIIVDSVLYDTFDLLETSQVTFLNNYSSYSVGMRFFSQDKSYKFKSLNFARSNLLDTCVLSRRIQFKTDDNAILVDEFYSEVYILDDSLKSFSFLKPTSNDLLLAVKLDGELDIDSYQRQLGFLKTFGRDKPEIIDVKKFYSNTYILVRFLYPQKSEGIKVDFANKYALLVYNSAQKLISAKVIQEPYFGELLTKNFYLSEHEIIFQYLLKGESSEMALIKQVLSRSSLDFLANDSAFISLEINDTCYSKMELQKHLLLTGNFKLINLSNNEMFQLHINDRLRSKLRNYQIDQIIENANQIVLIASKNHEIVKMSFAKHLGYILTDLERFEKCPENSLDHFYFRDKFLFVNESEFTILGANADSAP